MNEQALSTGPAAQPGSAVPDWTAPERPVPPPDGLARLRRLATRLAGHPSALDLLADIDAVSVELEANRARSERLAVAAEVAELLATHPDIDESLARVAHVAIPRLADACVICLADEAGRIRRVACEHAVPALQPLLEDVVRRFGPGSSDADPLTEALQTGQSVFLPNVAPDLFERALAPADVRRFQAVLPCSSIAIPLRTRGRVLGVMALFMAESGRHYGQEDLELAQVLAQRASIAVDNAILFGELEEAHALLDTLFRSTPVGLALLDRELKFVRLNDAMAEMVGVDAAAAVGRTAREVAPRLGRYAERAAKRLMDGGEPLLSLELDARRTVRSRPAHWLVTLYPVRTPAGKCVGIGVAVVDITARKLAEIAARSAREAAEAASRAKTQFLAVMSHELRTPLTTVIGYADLLACEASGPMTGRQRDQLRRIKGSAWHLVGIIEEILTFARAEAGKARPEFDLTDVARLAREAAESVGPLAQAKGLAFQLVGAEVPLRVVTDGGKIRQILLNLVGNAVKFTERGGVEVELGERDGEVTFVVRDTGIGIAAEDQEAVFEPFRQLDQSSTREKGGTGLGLTVSRQLARLLGGNVTLSSRPGAGSTFTLTIPCARSQSALSSSMAAVPSGR